jgi:hypothetical protein
VGPGCTFFFGFFFWTSLVVLSQLHPVCVLCFFSLSGTVSMTFFQFVPFSLVHRWPSDSLSYSGTLGDMFNSDSSEDLTSGVTGGISSGHRIMKASRPGTRLALLLRTLVGVLASWSVLTFW